MGIERMLDISLSDVFLSIESQIFDKFCKPTGPASQA